MCVSGELLKAKNFMLVVDCKVVCGHINGFSAAVAMLFAAYYNLNLAYPSGVAATMEFLQR